MHFDHIIIGSGLSAIGTLLGLGAAAKVLVIGGPIQGSYRYYAPNKSVPCSYLGTGGLGNDWHGVIPLGRRGNRFGLSDNDFHSVFSYFYPRTDLSDTLGQNWQFVPWRAIRPKREMERLRRERSDRLSVVHDLVTKLQIGQSSVRVMAGQQTFTGSKLWICAGALYTPDLIGSLLGRDVRRITVSDHVGCYIGQVTDNPAPRVLRRQEGVFFETFYDGFDSALYTLRPAHFQYRSLDFGVKQREAFGMPAAKAAARIAKRMSPALFSEAVFNRTGLFSRAAIYSVYAQIEAPDSYQYDSEAGVVNPIVQSIRKATDLARARQPFTGLTPSQLPDLHLPMIHLHNSLEISAIKALGANQPDSLVQVADASILGSIGPEHHSFKMVASAFSRARAAS